MPFINEGLTYRVATWVTHPDQRQFRWSEEVRDPNWNAVGFAGSAVPAERCPIDLNALIIGALALALGRAWCLTPSERAQLLIKQFLNEGNAIVTGNLSPGPTAHRGGRAFCSAEGEVRLANSGGRIPFYLLVARDHDPDEIRMVANRQALLFSAEI